MTAVPEFPALSRRSIGNGILKGRGYEIGAGLSPSRFAQVADLVFIDKRSPDELANLFGARPIYPVVALEDATAPLDFVTAHHVLEHLPDPIGALRSWLRLVRDGGTIFLSIPSSRHACENGREVTPAGHLLMDHLMEADGRDFDSRNHIPSFICQWTVMQPEGIWYAQDGAGAFSKQLLQEQARVEGHDLHWHTYSAETFALCVEVAAYLEGWSVPDLAILESADEMFATGTVARSRQHEPAALATFRSDLNARLKELQR